MSKTSVKTESTLMYVLRLTFTLLIITSLVAVALAGINMVTAPIIADANEDAKNVVADLLAATVHSIDPEFTVVVVQ